MPFPLLIPLITAGASAVGGALANRKRSQTQTTSTTLPAEFGPLQAMMIQRMTERMRNPSALPAGYETGGVKAINDTFGAGQANLENTLSARGLSRSPIAGAPLTRMEGNRLSTIGGFRSGLPLLEQQMQRQNEQDLMDMLGQARGTSTTGTTPSDMMSGGVQGLASMLGFLYGQGVFGGRGGGMPGAPTSGKMPIPGMQSPGVYNRTWG